MVRNRFSRRRGSAGRTRPRRGRLAPLAAATAVAATAVVPLVSAPASAHHRTPDGFVYTQTNDPTGNEVVGFRRSSDGSLQRIGAWSTGGLGYGTPDTLQLGPDDNDSSVVISPNRQWLLTTNAGSDTIAVLRIQPDGTLRPAPGSPFRSGGVMPISLQMQGTLLYVVNKDDDPARRDTPQTPNYTAFRIDHRGTLTPVPGSTIAAPEGSSPAQVFRATGRLFFGADFFTSTLRTFERQLDGRLVQTSTTQLTPASTPEAPNFPIGMERHPDEPLLYVGQPAVGIDFNDLSKRFGEIGIYRWDAQGRLTYLRSVDSSGSAVCWLLADEDGDRLYASNSVNGTVDTFDVSDPDDPVLIDTDVAVQGGATRELALSDDGRFLHVTSNRFISEDPATNQVAVLRVARDGTLTLVDSERVGGPSADALGVVTTG